MYVCMYVCLAGPIDPSIIVNIQREFLLTHPLTNLPPSLPPGEADEILKNEEDPFLLSGCQITGGSGCFVAIAVGKESRWGRIRDKLETENKDTPLQEKLDDMANLIG